MASENRHPTGDMGTGAVLGTRRLIMAQDLVADVAGAETEITAVAAMGEGGMVQTPTPPTKTDRKLRAADRTDAKEVSHNIWDDGLRGMGKPLWDQPLAPTGEGGASHLAPTWP